MGNVSGSGVVAAPAAGAAPDAGALVGAADGAAVQALSARATDPKPARRRNARRVTSLGMPPPVQESVSKPFNPGYAPQTVHENSIRLAAPRAAPARQLVVPPGTGPD